MEKLDNRILHVVLYFSIKCSVSFQTAWAFAIILAASLSLAYLHVASVNSNQKHN